MFNLWKNQNDYWMIWVVWSFALLYVQISSAYTKGIETPVPVSVYQRQALLEGADNWMGRDMEKNSLLYSWESQAGVLYHCGHQSPFPPLQSLYVAWVSFFLNLTWGFSPSIPVSSLIKNQNWPMPPWERPETFTSS